jgi:predicted peroxiredoxin
MKTSAPLVTANLLRSFNLEAIMFLKKRDAATLAKNVSKDTVDNPSPCQRLEFNILCIMQPVVYHASYKILVILIYSAYLKKKKIRHSSL